MLRERTLFLISKHDMVATRLRKLAQTIASERTRTSHLITFGRMTTTTGTILQCDLEAASMMSIVLLGHAEISVRHGRLHHAQRMRQSEADLKGRRQWSFPVSR